MTNALPKEGNGVYSQVHTLFEQKGWLENGAYTETGLYALAKLLDILPPVHEGRWGPAFLPLMEKIEAGSAELIIVRDNKVLLTYRKDDYWDGWHTPGGYIGPGESWKDTASRVAQRELGCGVTFDRYLRSFNQTDNPRTPDISNLILCRPEGEPKTGKWFNAMPDNILAHHKKFWPVIEQCLR